MVRRRWLKEILGRLASSRKRLIQRWTSQQEVGYLDRATINVFPNLRWRQTAVQQRLYISPLAQCTQVATFNGEWEVRGQWQVSLTSFKPSSWGPFANPLNLVEDSKLSQKAHPALQNDFEPYSLVPLWLIRKFCYSLSPHSVAKSLASYLSCKATKSQWIHNFFSPRNYCLTILRWKLRSQETDLNFHPMNLYKFNEKSSQ